MRRFFWQNFAATFGTVAGTDMHQEVALNSAEHEPSRALMLVGPTSGTAGKDSSNAPSRFRDTCIGPLAAFVTQLIACRHRLPEYRTRRLADPAEATQRYDAVEHRPMVARCQIERRY
jgi:hypothetical protein